MPRTLKSVPETPKAPPETVPDAPKSGPGAVTTPDKRKTRKPPSVLPAARTLPEIGDVPLDATAYQ
ncbi:MAG: hypothetical protein ACHREM_32670, partial [Polyangiales bacterium]